MKKAVWEGDFTKKRKERGDSGNGEEQWYQQPDKSLPFFFSFAEAAETGVVGMFGKRRTCSTYQCVCGGYVVIAVARRRSR